MRYNSMDEWNLHKQQKYSETFEVLKKIIQQCNGSMDDAIASSLNMVCRDVHAEAGTFWFYSKFGDGLIHPRAQFGGKEIKSQSLKLGEGITGQVIQHGRPAIVKNVQSDSRWESKVDRETGFVTKSILCVPLSTAEGVFGCIQLLNKTDGSTFDNEDMELVSVLCEEIANQFYDLNLLSDGRTVDNVAVMFADIRGFTRISKHLRPEQLAELVNRYLSYATKCIKNNGGVPNKYIGDCAMAYWTCDDAAYYACKTAREMVENSEDLINGIRNKFGVDLCFGLGINYGSVFVGNIGTPVLSDHTIIGDTVNTAAFLEECAPANSIYVSDSTVEQLRDRIVVHEVENDSLRLHKMDCKVYCIDKFL